MEGQQVLVGAAAAAAVPESALATALPGPDQVEASRFLWEISDTAVC